MSSNTRTTPEKVGRIAAKVASEAAYVITGMADVVAGTVRDVVNQGRAGYTERKAAGGGLLLGPGVDALVGLVAVPIILLLSCMSLASGTHNPFIYFQF